MKNDHFIKIMMYTHLRTFLLSEEKKNTTSL